MRRLALLLLALSLGCAQLGLPELNRAPSTPQQNWDRAKLGWITARSAATFGLRICELKPDCSLGAMQIEAARTVIRETNTLLARADTRVQAGTWDQVTVTEAIAATVTAISFAIEDLTPLIAMGESDS